MSVIWIKCVMSFHWKSIAFLLSTVSEVPHHNEFSIPFFWMSTNRKSSYLFHQKPHCCLQHHSTDPWEPHTLTFNDQTTDPRMYRTCMKQEIGLADGRSILRIKEGDTTHLEHSCQESSTNSFGNIFCINNCKQCNSCTFPSMDRYTLLYKKSV